MIENVGWLIEGRPDSNGGPVHHEDLVWLREQGIRAIVSLTERSLRGERLVLHRLDPLGFTQFVDEVAERRPAVLVHHVRRLRPDRDDAGLLPGESGAGYRRGDRRGARPPPELHRA